MTVFLPNHHHRLQCGPCRLNIKIPSKGRELQYSLTDMRVSKGMLPCFAVGTFNLIKNPLSLLFPPRPLPRTVLPLHSVQNVFAFSRKRWDRCSFSKEQELYWLELASLSSSPYIENSIPRDDDDDDAQMLHT